MGHVDVEIIGKGSRAIDNGLSSRGASSTDSEDHKMSAKEKAIYHEKRNKRAEV
jgi:hypothetical protein